MTGLLIQSRNNMINNLKMRNIAKLHKSEKRKRGAHMKLVLTDIEFSLLADLVYAGNLVINSWRANFDEIKPYR